MAVARDPEVGQASQSAPVGRPYKRPITGLQRAYSDLFVAWFRSSDVDRDRIAPALDLLGDAVRKARSGGQPGPR